MYGKEYMEWLELRDWARENYGPDADVTWWDNERVLVRESFRPGFFAPQPLLKYAS